VARATEVSTSEKVEPLETWSLPEVLFQTMRPAHFSPAVRLVISVAV